MRKKFRRNKTTSQNMVYSPAYARQAGTYQDLKKHEQIAHAFNFSC